MNEPERRYEFVVVDRFSTVAKAHFGILHASIKRPDICIIVYCSRKLKLNSEIKAKTNLLENLSSKRSRRGACHVRTGHDSCKSNKCCRCRGSERNNPAQRHSSSLFPPYRAFHLPSLLDSSPPLLPLQFSSLLTPPSFL